MKFNHALATALLLIVGAALVNAAWLGSAIAVWYATGSTAASVAAGAVAFILVITLEILWVDSR